MKKAQINKELIYAQRKQQLEDEKLEALINKPAVNAEQDETSNRELNALNEKAGDTEPPNEQLQGVHDSPKNQLPGVHPPIFKALTSSTQTVASPAQNTLPVRASTDTTVKGRGLTALKSAFDSTQKRGLTDDDIDMILKEAEKQSMYIIVSV